MELQFLPEAKFIKEFAKVLIDLFKYRVALSPDQFVQRGFTERKMVLVLDLYDLVKQVRKMAKIGYQKTRTDTQWQHACDQPIKQYQVIDHTRGVSKQMQFNMNACLLKSNVTCQNELDMLSGQPRQQPSDAPVIDREGNTHSGNGRLNYDAHQNETPGVYHLDREDRNPAAAAV